MNDAASMTENSIKARVNAKLAEYENRPLLEQYAIFMGKAQILEFGLKGLLMRRFNAPTDSVEHLTLGQTKNALRDRGLRPDFIRFLESVVEHRNNMAHEFLVNSLITQSIGEFSYRKLYGDLFRALYEIEQIIILYDWCEENDGWMLQP